MDKELLFVYSVVIIIIGIPILSGPTLSFVDVTTSPGGLNGAGEGNVLIDEVQVSGEIRIEPTFQSESYRLTVPDSRIHIQSLSGRPILNYEISIPVIGYSRSTTHILSSSDDGWQTIEFQSDLLTGEDITRNEYLGQLSISVRTNDTERVIYRESVTIEVTG